MQGGQVHLQNIAKGTTKPGIESKYDCCLRHKALMTQITLPLAPHLCPDKTRKNATNTKVLKRRKTLSNEWSALICTKLLVLGIKGGHRPNQVTQIRGSLSQVNAALSLFPIHAYALFTEALLFENYRSYICSVYSDMHTMMCSKSPAKCGGAGEGVQVCS